MEAIIFHSEDLDGFSSASAFVKKFNITCFLEKDRYLLDKNKKYLFIPMSYSDNSNVLDIISKFDIKKVYMLDYICSDYKDLIKKYNTTIIDHHESTKEKLLELDIDFEYIFDINHSAAYLTWKYLFNDVPEVVKYIEDFDIFRLKYIDETPFIQEYLSNLFNKTNSEILLELSKLSESFDKNLALSLGKTAFDKMLSVIFSALETISLIKLPTGEVLHSVNCPGFQTQIGSLLLNIFEGPILIYKIKSFGVTCSLRDDKGRAKDIAIKNGGGGHPNAAGFKIKDICLLKFNGLPDKDREKIRTFIKDLKKNYKNIHRIIYRST